MKNLVLLLSLLATSAFADNPEFYEYNNKITHENHYMTYRTTSEDSWHVEYGHKFDWLDVTYRYADLIITKEKRIKFTVPMFKYGSDFGDISLKARMEYRSFDNKEDHWRYRFIAGYQYNFNDHVQAWMTLQPRWAFKDQQTKFDSRDQIGIKFSYENISISPFAERYTNGEISNHTINIFGTYVVLKL
jgi:hypothetical protein